MSALDMANLLIDRHGYDIILNNVRLNTLVYWVQVTSLREHGRPAFDDPIEAWGMGPTEVEVFQAFKGYDRRRIALPRGAVPSDRISLSLVSQVIDEYGFLTTYDLVCFTQREGSAWRKAYGKGAETPMGDGLILASRDGLDRPGKAGTLASAIETVNRTWPNTFELLQHA
ncbi:Panacea domain-containing protein [Bifidobacterium xylocopae]|uniref:Panacea domain-containing protein n=1 Tax=Bifidobacterium xylocopae TaxID=2493119 RepID=UPI0013752E84|nr:type II toxin-antitoxin system antitoxin SocA domain-containing protein [Bifidobacterium xylocopae]